MRFFCAGFAVERSCGSHACAARIRMNRENKKRKIKGFILQIQWKWIQSNAVNVLIQVCWFTSLRNNCCRCELSRIHECARIVTTTTINDTIARYNNNHQDKSHFQFFSIRCSLIIVICHSHFISSSSFLFILNKHLLVHSHDDGGMCDNLAVARSKQRRTNRFDRSEQTKSKPSKTSFIWLFTE